MPASTALLITSAMAGSVPLISRPAGRDPITCSMVEICAGTFQSDGPKMEVLTPTCLPHRSNAASSCLTYKGRLTAVVTSTYSSFGLFFLCDELLVLSLATGDEQLLNRHIAATQTKTGKIVRLISI